MTWRGEREGGQDERSVGGDTHTRPEEILTALSVSLRLWGSSRLVLLMSFCPFWSSAERWEVRVLYPVPTGPDGEHPHAPQALRFSWRSCVFFVCLCDSVDLRSAYRTWLTPSAGFVCVRFWFHSDASCLLEVHSLGFQICFVSSVRLNTQWVWRCFCPALVSFLIRIAA